MANRTLTLTPAEYLHLVNTLEGCQEEIETLIQDVDWYTTELPDRLTTALEILETAEVK